MRLALLTCADLSGFVTDDSLLEDALRRANISYAWVPWAEPTDWRKFSAALIRTTWDYTKHLPRFHSVLEKIVSAGVQLFNPLSLVKWNSDKSYLLELQSRGLATIPTRSLSEVLRDPTSDWGRVLIKPRVGANSDGITIGDLAELRARPPSRPESLLVQPFMPEIYKGELSLHFFGGEFSHAIRKTPRAGDFRVQEEHGGLIESHRASTEEVAAAQIILRALPAEPLYARVDLLPSKGGLLLMELELIEPSLYFRTDPASADRLVTKLRERLASNGE